MRNRKESKLKRYFILVDVNKASQTTRIQLRDDRGSRPGTRAATPSHPARVYVEYFEANTVAKGMRKFTMLREELERLVN